MPTTKKAKKTTLEEKLANFLEFKQNSNENDDDMAFYKSTMPLIKYFTSEQRMQYRIQIMQLIQNISNPLLQPASSRQTSNFPVRSSYAIPTVHYDNSTRQLYQENFHFRPNSSTVDIPENTFNNSSS
ncbi:hypothetical protein KPH14_012669 [Odynerus spinipes]|uniref:BESS domain-containing protein n=1 Tax=Odynerus spinipes TaxID=1348599 RepID=A0AAD9RG15_9HYME|nr:hypothetical protein KPH14_012669 [Odynerus spinipes]